MESSNLIKLTCFTEFVHNALFRHTFQNFLYIIIMDTLLKGVTLGCAQAHLAHPVAPPMPV
jgi:hypothetical protein